MQWIIGVDEAGRGPLAGPVTVGLVKIPVDFDWQLISGVNDSKKISEKKREILFARAKELADEGLLEYVVKSVSARSIDSKGIAPAIKRAISSGLAALQADESSCVVKLDGSLAAPEKFSQETIVGGDGKEPVIGLASILAKVTRDRYMVKQDVVYPVYGLAQHKGYGTKAHRAAISQYGFSPIHRRSYCTNIILL